MSLSESVEINKNEYVVNKSNYFDDKFTKTQIVLGNTYSKNMSHVIGWNFRKGGNYTNIAPFTISKYGEIFQHFEPEYYSDFIGMKHVDKTIIPILIENEGYLFSDLKIGNKYYDYLGRDYTGSEVIAKKWRNQSYWAPYSDTQLNATVLLVKHLINKFNIEKNVIGHNTKFDDIYKYKGVCYRSNYNTIYTDISPSWDFNKFKEKILSDD